MTDSEQRASPSVQAIIPPKAYEEANVSRLGLISIQERIPEDYTTWKVEFFRHGRPSILQCVASAEYGGVPHGLDGDVVTAITDLYIEQGAPEDGVIKTTAYQLLKRAGFGDGGHYYAALKRSLHRLRFAGYSASECWRDAERDRWVTVTFTYLSGLNFSAEGSSLDLSRGSELELTLAEPIARSIRANYLKPLDYGFLRSLDRPATRSLFRLLDARRYDPLSLSEPLTTLRVGLVEWAKDCKIANLSPDKIRRALESAHEELVTRGYLKAVSYVGKGTKQVVTYEFQDQAETGSAAPEVFRDNPALQQMIERQISKPVAVRLLAQFGEVHILERLTRANQILASGFQPKSVGAFLVDVVKDAVGKYDEHPRAEDSESVSRRKATAARAAKTRALEEEHAAKEVDMLQKTPEERVKTAFQMIKVALGRRLKPGDADRILIYLSSNKIDLERIVKEALSAKVSGTIEQFYRDLQTALASP